jgi:hypothetical protein
MTARNHFNEKKSPMTTNPALLTAEAPATLSAMTEPIRSRSTAMNLINEALSRARMRSPQNVHSEARRSARRIAIEARHQQARELGNLSQFGIR